MLNRFKIFGLILIASIAITSNKSESSAPGGSKLWLGEADCSSRTAGTATWAFIWNKGGWGCYCNGWNFTWNENLKKCAPPAGCCSLRKDGVQCDTSDDCRGICTSNAIFSKKCDKADDYCSGCPD